MDIKVGFGGTNDINVTFSDSSKELNTLASISTSKDHSALINRDANDQHPISAITGLQEALDSKETSYAAHSVVNQHNVSTTAHSDIRELISGKAAMQTASVSLTSGGWSTTADGVSKTVTVSGVTSSSNLIASPDKDSRSAWSDANICAGAQGADTITFYADKAPEETVTVNVLILN